MATEQELRDLKYSFQQEITHWQSKFNEVQKQLENVRVEADNSIVPKPCQEDVKVIQSNCDAATKGLDEMNKKWSKCLEGITERLLESDQYSKKNNLLLHGFRRLPNLNGLDFIFFIADLINRLFPSLRGIVRPIHIDDAHPLKTRNDNQNNKVVIVKFANRWVKHDILRCELDLEGTPFKVTEHLTAHTLKLKSLAGDLAGKDNVWTFKTQVYVQYDNKKYTIRNFTDLKSLERLIHPISVTNTILGRDSSINTQRDNDSQHLANDKFCDLEQVTREARAAREHYLLNYPSLYDSMLLNNNNSQPFRGTSYVMRGRPSRNGRGRGFARHK